MYNLGEMVFGVEGVKENFYYMWIFALGLLLLFSGFIIIKFLFKWFYFFNSFFL